MSQHKRTSIIIAAFILLIALTFYAAQTRLGAQIAEIESAVSDIRGLERLGETRLSFVARSQIEAESDASAEDATEPDEDLERIFAFYRALDLIAPDLDLAGAYREYFSANVAGFFEYEAEEITILREAGTLFAPLTFFESFIYAHEFMHVLQDQHYDLTALWERVGERENFDLWLATDALIEGDAVALEWALYDRLWMRMSDRELDYIFLQPVRVPIPLSAPKPAPAIIKAAFNFPYDQGYVFVESLIESGGWERVHQAFTSDPPQSTEQIYHPERYLAGEAPIDVSLPNFSEIIGDGTRQVYDGAVGEFYLRQHLLTTLSQAEAAAAASGWGGDRLRIYKHSAADELLWAWHLVWDRAGDAFEFAGAYRRFLDLRYEQVKADGRCWSEETTHCFARFGESETRISMAADQETALALLALDG